MAEGKVEVKRKRANLASGSAMAVAKDANLHDLALAIISGCRTRKELCARMQLSPRKINELVGDDRFSEIYAKVRDDFHSNITTTLCDEKAQAIVRDVAIATRSRTLLAEVMEEIRSQLKEADVKATVLKTGVDAARLGLEGDPSRRRGANVQQNVAIFAPSAGQAKAIVEAREEAEIDLSDVVDGEYEVVSSDEKDEGSEDGNVEE